MSEVVLAGVGKVYPDGTRAVQGVDLHIGDGEFLVLVGPSGCGKTTVLRMVAGLEDISEGTVRIGDTVVNDLPPRQRDVAMVFQSYALYPHLSVADNIGFGLKLRKVPADDIKRRVAEAANILGLEEHLKRKPRNLSGGQRQRVAMGRAIVRRPQAFLMDEPLSNLDAKLRVQMRAEIARLQRDLDVTTIYVTHDQTEAMTLGDRVAVMRKGTVQQVDAPQVLYEHPVNLFVAGFIGSPAMNFVEASIDQRDGGLVLTVGSQTLTVGEQLLADRPALRGYLGRKVIVGIRPEDMEDAAVMPGDSGRRLRSTADLVESMGSEVLVHFAVDAPHPVTEDTQELAEDAGGADLPGLASGAGPGATTVVARFSPRSDVREHASVDVSVDTDRLHVFDAETRRSIWDTAE